MDLLGQSDTCLAAQYFWDFTNASLREWWVENMFAGALSGNEGVVDGCFSDDATGIGAEHVGVTDRTGISREKTQALLAASGVVIYTPLIIFHE